MSEKYQKNIRTQPSILLWIIPEKPVNRAVSDMVFNNVITSRINSQWCPCIPRPQKLCNTKNLGYLHPFKIQQDVP